MIKFSHNYLLQVDICVLIFLSEINTLFEDKLITFASYVNYNSCRIQSLHTALNTIHRKVFCARFLVSTIVRNVPLTRLDDNPRRDADSVAIKKLVPVLLPKAGPL